MVPNKYHVHLPNSDNAHRPGMKETTAFCFVQLSSHSDLSKIIYKEEEKEVVKLTEAP